VDNSDGWYGIITERAIIGLLLAILAQGGNATPEDVFAGSRHDALHHDSRRPGVPASTFSTSCTNSPKSSINTKYTRALTFENACQAHSYISLANAQFQRSDKGALIVSISIPQAQAILSAQARYNLSITGTALDGDNVFSKTQAFAKDDLVDSAVHVPLDSGLIPHGKKLF
jgi:hypothetical protein